MSLQICDHCAREFAVTEEDKRMYQSFDIPISVICPRCRWRQIMAFWIFGRFRIGTSDLSGKQIITTLPKSIKSPVYARDEWFF